MDERVQNRNLTHELTQEDRAAGGRRSGEVRREKANLKKAMEAGLNGYIEVDGALMKCEEALAISMINAAGDGNVAAFRAIMELVSKAEDEREAKIMKTLAEIEKLKADTERIMEDVKKIQAETELLKLKAKAEDPEEMDDDGFIAALSASAAEDWADED